jgi:hypothetical protein
VNEWAWGHISAAEVQRIAYLAYQDECNLLAKLGCPSSAGSTSLKALSGLGNSGRCNQNIHRDLMIYFGEPDAPPPLKVLIPVRNVKPTGDNDDIFKHAMPFMLPHVEFAYLFNHKKEFFNKYIYIYICIGRCC